MPKYEVFWSAQGDEVPTVEAPSYTEALKLAYEEIPVSLYPICSQCRLGMPHDTTEDYCGAECEKKAKDGETVKVLVTVKVRPKQYVDDRYPVEEYAENIAGEFEGMNDGLSWRVESAEVVK